MLREITECTEEEAAALLGRAEGCVSLACDYALGMESLSGLQPAETRGWEGPPVVPGMSGHSLIVWGDVLVWRSRSG